MRRDLAHRLLVVLCLVATSLAQTVFSSLGVRCTDGSGRTRIELLCDKTPEPNRGSCPSSGESCRDEPVGAQAGAVRAWTAANVEAELVSAAPAVWRLITPLFPPIERDLPEGCAMEVWRPPASLACLRTVILLV